MTIQTRPTALAPTGTTTLAGLSEAQRLAVAKAIGASVAPNTAAAYRSAWGAWTAWADREAHSPLPATPQSVAAYLADLANAKSVATCRLHRAAISKAHKLSGQADPTASELVRAALEGIARTAKVAGRGQAKPISADDLAAIQAVATQPRELGPDRKELPSSALVRGTEDSVIAGLLFQAALRRSELAALTWADIADAPAGSPCDGLLVTVRRSKTNQDGSEADVRFIKNGTAQAVRRLRELRGAPADSDRVLTLTPESIGNRFAAACRAAGIEGKRTAHSGRVGHASELTLRGASMQDVMRSGGWKSSRMVAHYSAGATAVHGAVARYL